MAHEAPGPTPAARAAVAGPSGAGPFASFAEELAASVALMRTLFDALDAYQQGGQEGAAPPDWERLRGRPGAQGGRRGRWSVGSTGCVHDGSCAPACDPAGRVRCQQADPARALWHRVPLRSQTPTSLSTQRVPTCPCCAPTDAHMHPAARRATPRDGASPPLAYPFSPPGVRLEPTSWQDLTAVLADGSERALGSLGRSPLGIKAYW